MMRVIRRKTMFLILLYLFFFILPFFMLTTKASLIQEEVPISVNVNANISQGLIYIAPLPQQTQVFGQNYYVSNSLGYYEYSYLFSATPPLLVWYEPAPSSQTYYFVYGGSTQASAVTTGVFSFYTQFYYLNSSIFNVSGVSLLGGSLVLNGQNSLVTFTTTALRYTSAVILYTLQSSAVVTPPELIYSGSIPSGSIVTLSLFSYSNLQTIPSYTAFPFGSTTWVMASDGYVKSSQFTISNSQFTYNAQVAGMPNEEVAQVTLPQPSAMYGFVFGSSVSLQYPSIKYLAPQTVAPPSITFNGTFAVSQSASYGYNSVLLEDPVYFFNPTLLNGSNILVYNDSKWYSLPVQASNLKLDLNHIAMYILPYNSSSNYIYFEDIPAGSVISVKYANGTTYSFTASGKTVNTVGGVSLVNLEIYGRNVVGITIQPSLTNTQVSYNMLIGFTDFLHKAGLIINTTGVYVYNSQTSVIKLSNPRFPSDVAVGYADIGNTFYLIGFYYYPGSFYTFITPMPNAVASTGIVPYINYNGTIPLSVSSIGITLSSGLYYETTGIVTIATGLPTPLQSSVLSLTTAPGDAIVNNNNAIYQTKLTNSSSSLTLIGFSGYNLIVQYGSIESQLIISSNYYPTNLPTNLQVVVTVSESSRTITISTSPLPVKPVQVASLNVTNTTTVTYNGSSGSSFITNIHSTNNQLIGIITYYSFLAIAVASYRYSSQLWSSTLFLSFATLSIGLLFGNYIVLPFSIGAVILGFIFKRLNI